MAEVALWTLWGDEAWNAFWHTHASTDCMTKATLPLSSSNAPSRAGFFQGLVIAAILTTALYVGREVLVPLALAILMSFVLTPPLLFLRRLGLPRVLGVGLVVTSAFVFLVALGWLMSREVSQLAFDLPRYQSTLATKITQISKSTANSPAVRQITQAFQNFQQELAHPKPDTSVGTVPAPPEQVRGSKKTYRR